MLMNGLRNTINSKNMNKKSLRSWKKFNDNQKSLSQREYIKFLDYISQSGLKQKDVVFLSDEFKVDPIIFWTINRLSHLEKGEVKKIIEFTRSIDFISPLLDIPEQDRSRILNKFQKEPVLSNKIRELFYIEIDKARSKKSNTLTPEGILADQLMRKVWKTLAKDSEKWIFTLNEKDQKRLEKLSVHSKKRRDLDLNWAAGICINAIKLGDICSKEDGGSDNSNFIYNQFIDYSV